MRTVTIGEDSNLSQLLLTKPLREPLCLETSNHSPIALLLPPDAEDVVRRYYAQRLREIMHRTSQKAGLSDEEAWKLLNEDD